MEKEMAEEDYETWQANGRIVLRRIQLTEQERMMNQDYVVEERQDPFVNGTLSPVRLPQSETTQAFIDNPNTMSEDDMVELLNGHHNTFKKKLDEISSPYAVRRMIAIAKSDDVDVTIKRVEALESRLRELTGEDDVPVTEHERITGA
jgi:hypothetical protein